MYDAIVVGSGPAGTAAALGLKGKNCLVLDVGRDASDVPKCFSGSQEKLESSRQDLFDFYVGEDYSSLQNLDREPQINLKLKSPYNKFIIDGFDELTPIESENFAGVISLSKGGLANGWGAGVFRYNDEDLKEFPISYSDLEKYYDELALEIGISGSRDDLFDSFLEEPSLQAPILLSRFSSALIEAYQKKREYINDLGVTIGRGRLAVLTRETNGRSAYQYENAEFFRVRDPAVYSPAYSLNRLIQHQLVEYRDKYLVEYFEQSEGCVSVHARNVDDGSMRKYFAKKLFLAAGTLNTARIVLNSNADSRTKLPILDNPLTAFPLLKPSLIGEKISATDCSLGQLVAVSRLSPESLPIQSAIFGTNGPLRSDVLTNLPLPLNVSRRMMSLTAAATGLVMNFHPGKLHSTNYLRLGKKNALEVNYEPESQSMEVECQLIRALRSLGFFSHRSLLESIPMGNSLHFAGAFPMKHAPTQYQTDKLGLLYGSSNVHIVDGGCFSALPAKNHTFTIMANSLRIVKNVLG